MEKYDEDEAVDKNRTKARESFWECGIQIEKTRTRIINHKITKRVGNLH